MCKFMYRKVPERREKMKHLKRIISVILVLCMLASSLAFAATPKASIISPLKNSVVSDDQLLVSVKVSDKKKVAVKVFEEKVVTGTKFDEEKQADVEILTAIDVSEFTEEILTALDKEYEENKVIILGEEENKQVLRSVLVTEPVTYTATGETGYFSKLLENITPGLYKVQVEVLGKDDEVEETYYSFTAVQKKADTDEQKENVVPVETVKISIVQVIAKFIKSLIK